MWSSVKHTQHVGYCGSTHTVSFSLHDYHTETWQAISVTIPTSEEWEVIRIKQIWFILGSHWLNHLWAAYQIHHMCANELHAVLSNVCVLEVFPLFVLLKMEKTQHVFLVCISVKEKTHKQAATKAQQSSAARDFYPSKKKNFDILFLLKPLN